MTPPPWTCPGIDAALTLARRIEWRLKRGRFVEALGLLPELRAALERVRVENKAMREWVRVQRAGDTVSRGGVE